jgi:hypothetical protein
MCRGDAMRRATQKGIMCRGDAMRRPKQKGDYV